MKFINAVAFATAASAAAIQDQRSISLDTLEQVDTTLEAIVTTLNQRNPNSPENISAYFFQSRILPLTTTIRQEAIKIYKSGKPIPFNDAKRLLAPAENFPSLATSLHSVLKAENVRASIIQQDVCNGVKSSISGLQDALAGYGEDVRRFTPNIDSNANYNNLVAFVDSLAETGAMFKDC
ncbi:hypothetical protein RJ55_10015 [Drechmeria coniospora]|nr:hypothetical protein RJ55_10015 [Drechmeria coniospora]